RRSLGSLRCHLRLVRLFCARKKIMSPNNPRNKIGFSTTAIHVGQEPDELTGSVAAPIHPTSTYAQQEIGKHKGYEYARVSNPTRDRLEKNLAALEGGRTAHVFASGMGSVSSL